MRGLVAGAALVVAASLGWGAAPLAAQVPALTTTLRPLVASARPVRSCESLDTLALPNTTIDSAAVASTAGAPGGQGAPGAAPLPAVSFCRVVATVTHPPAGDRVRVWVGLPMEGWNGRFQGVGGGGFSGGSAGSIARPVAQGFAAGATDTGHPGGSGSFALDSAGRLDWMLIRDNAYLGIHDMTRTAKALVQAFYGAPPARSYFNGCSTGGRQGLSEAQRYPTDYDGILSGAPAINWPKLHVEQLWGTVMMLQANNPVPACKYAAATAAAIAACDGIDGVRDGVLEDPLRCTFDPSALVGTTAGDCGAFTAADATVIRAIWNGPRRRDGSFLWYGLARGGDFMGLSGTAGEPLAPRPNNITLDWLRYFLEQDPQAGWASLTPAAYEQLWDQSVEQYGPVFGTDNPDLSAFRERGGKLILWHGQADPLIYPMGTVDYYHRVQQAMGGAGPTAAFARLFLAPGVGHCAGGAGPQPAAPFDALIDWVENGRAPDTLLAVRRDASGAVTRSRPLCQYPRVARYRGTGSTDDAASFTCAEGF